MVCNNIALRYGLQNSYAYAVEASICLLNTFPQNIVTTRSNDPVLGLCTLMKPAHCDKSVICWLLHVPLPFQFQRQSCVHACVGVSALSMPFVISSLCRQWCEKGLALNMIKVTLRNQSLNKFISNMNVQCKRLYVALI